MSAQVQKYYRTALVVLFVLVFIIAFQTYQQIFYIERFELAQGVVFLDVLKNQAYRWIIWFLIALCLPFIVRKDTTKDLNFQLAFKHFVIISVLVVLNIAIISFMQAMNADNENWQAVFSESFVFFLVQKAPMYILGYIAFTVILFFHYKNEKLQVTVQELVDLKDQHQKEYEQLKTSNIDKDQILSIKIGNKLKVIPIVNILWIEADDYCVVVHSIDQSSYTMRSSLKALETKLPPYFMRVHRKGIVNMNKVQEFKNGNDSLLILENKDEVPVSKTNVKAVKVFLQQTS